MTAEEIFELTIDQVVATNECGFKFEGVSFILEEISSTVEKGKFDIDLSSAESRKKVAEELRVTFSERKERFGKVTVRDVLNGWVAKHESYLSDEPCIIYARTKIMKDLMAILHDLGLKEEDLKSFGRPLIFEAITC